MTSSNGGVTHAEALAMTRSEADMWMIAYGEAAGGKFDHERGRFLTLDEQQHG